MDDQALKIKAKLNPARTREPLLPARYARLPLPVGNGTATFVDDAYNANPLSMKAMLNHMAERAVPGRKHFLLGDMLELGEESDVYHRALVPTICATGAETVILIGEHMQALAPELESHINNVLLAENNEQAQLKLTELLQPGDLLVAKGSNKFKLSDLLKSMST